MAKFAPRQSKSYSILTPPLKHRHTGDCAQVFGLQTFPCSVRRIDNAGKGTSRS